MATFIGTSAAEIITPGFVSGSVLRPPGVLPTGAADILFGGDGNDTLNGGGGSDASYGGNGDDYIYAVLGVPETIVGGSGTDTLDTTAFAGNYVVNLATGLTNFAGETFTEMENILSGAGNDTLTGTSGDNSINGGAGADSMNAGDGNDTYFVDNLGDVTVESFDDALGGVDSVFASASHTIGFGIENLTLTGSAAINGTGNALGNVITGNLSSNILTGGEGNDTLNGGGGSDASYGGNGDDYIYAVLGVPETIVGGSGTDTLDTTAFAGNYVVNLATGLTNFAGETFTEMENLISGAGNDRLTGTGGSNSIWGGDGNDTIDGAGGSDASYGGNGDDYIYAVLGVPETIVGGSGTDTLDTTAFAGNYVVNLATGLTNFAGETFTEMENIISGAGNDKLTGTKAANQMDGGFGNDTVIGGNGNDVLSGGFGNDSLSGGSGTDALSGQAGDDRLTGGAGVDVLIGGFGADRFIFTKATDSGPTASDTVRAGDGAVAFEGAGAAAGDLFDLTKIDADTALAGNQTFSFGGSGLGQLQVVDDLATGNSIVLANIDADAAFEFRLVIEDGATLASAYTAADFLL